MRGARLRLAVPVIEPVEARDHAHAAEVELVRAGVVRDVVRLARSVGEKLEARVPRPKGVRDSRSGGSGDDVAAPNRMLLVAQQADALAAEDDEDFLLRGVAVGRYVQLPGRGFHVRDSRTLGACGDPELAARGLDLALPPLLVRKLVDVDDSAGARAWVGEIGRAERRLCRPLVGLELRNPDRAHA